jgi:hypothetical protein
MEELVRLVRDNTGSSAPKFVNYVTALVEEAGGVEMLAAFHWSQIEEAAINKPGGKVVLDALYAVSKMMAAAHPMIQETPDLLNQTDEEIKLRMVEDLKTIAIAQVLETFPMLREVIAEAKESETNEPKRLEVEDDRPPENST